MGTFAFGRYAVSLTAVAALLAGCGGSQPPIGAPGAMPQSQTSAIAMRAAHGSLTKRNASAYGYKILHHFGKGSDGNEPEASPIIMGGMLYATTTSGGKYDLGTVYSSTTNGTEKILHSFSDGEGYYPMAGLVDVKDTLYGTADSGPTSSRGYGYGTVFSITASGGESVLYTFQGAPDGWGPQAGLVDVNGTLYGTTIYGGKYDLGTVFSVTTNGTEKVLHSFGKGSDGSRPTASLVYLKGTLYGTTLTGGNTSTSYPGDGTVFSITMSGTEKILHRFGGNGDGSNPDASLTDVKGTFYGTTMGSSGYGTVFSITPSGTEKVVHNFGGSDGSEPQGNLMNVRGTLYGTTHYGGAHNWGTAFSVTTSGAVKVLHSFEGGTDGCCPVSGLIALNGVLYGTASVGGKFYGGGDDGGTLFSLTP